MVKPCLPRPSMSPKPPSEERAETTVVADSADLAKILEDAGLDPSTITFKKRDYQQSQQTLADLLDDEVVNEVLRDDLTDGEAALFAGAMWIGKFSKNTERARSIWRVMTFLLKFPAAGYDDIPPRLLTDSFFNDYAHPRNTISALVHNWTRARVFSRARNKLNNYSLYRWKQHRRNQLDIICEWEVQINSRAEVRRKDRLVKKLKPRGPKR